MCSIADCRCKCFVSPRFWNLATALFSLKDITIRSYCRCQLPIGSLSLDQACENTSNTSNYPQGSLTCCTLKSLSSGCSFPSSQPCIVSFSPNTNSSIPTRLLSAPKSCFAGWCCTSEPQQVWCFLCGTWSMLFPSLMISEASLNKPCLKIYCHFSWPQGNPWAWEVQRQHPLSYSSGV